MGQYQALLQQGFGFFKEKISPKYSDLLTLTYLLLISFFDFHQEGVEVDVGMYVHTYVT